MARRYDPERRQRIIDAAIRVVAAHGISGLSHRAVAAEADVPLGSTTYHFASRDDLLVAAMRQLSDGWLAGMERWERSLDPGRSLAEELTRLVDEYLGIGPARLRMEYELYLVALRHPLVRPVAAEFVDGAAGILGRRTPDARTARALIGLLDGLLMQSVVTGRTLDREELRAALEQHLAGGCQHGARR